jgi:uncharacterized integral membrane protein
MGEEYDDYLERSSASNRRIVAMAVAGIIVISALFFILQNTVEVEIKFLFLSGNAPLYVVIVISMVLGALLTLVATWLRRRSRRKNRDRDD